MISLRLRPYHFMIRPYLTSPVKNVPTISHRQLYEGKKEEPGNNGAATKNAKSQELIHGVPAIRGRTSVKAVLLKLLELDRKIQQIGKNHNIGFEMRQNLRGV